MVAGDHVREKGVTYYRTENLRRVSYTPADAKNGRSVEEYMAMIRATTRAFNENSREGKMVYRAWKQLHPRLRRKVDRSEASCFYKEFRRLLLRKQFV
ncbi:hypothetical protein KEM52_000031 [Ascosphaera acerosa]|nr:hypothetical protein KEM52_000031 [Ascosphaera acerosa]